VVLLAGQSIEGIRENRSQHAVAALNACRDDRLLALLVGRSAHLVAETLTIPSAVLPFQDRPEDMARCYHAADLTSTAHEVETFGRIAAESQMCGTPVVAFAAGGLADVVEDGKTGVLVPTGDVTALQNAFQHLSRDRATVLRMAANARQSARARFCTSEIAGKYIRQYQELLSQGRPESWRQGLARRCA
jgi:glycosyltransferase involved in cell wall biosynthesis